MTVTDLMDDRFFDQPLTVKVRLGTGWTEAVATQAGKPIPSSVVQHDGNAYAFVRVVPDRDLVHTTR